MKIVAVFSWVFFFLLCRGNGRAVIVGEFSILHSL